MQSATSSKAAAIVLALLVVLVLQANAAHAEGGTNAAARTPIGVVELFTSQGCNSCPPADAVLGRFAREGDIIALGYHIDYWDYLGWRDTLGSPEFTARQYAYRASLGTTGVYTPQAVLNGRRHLNGADEDGIRSGLKALSGEGAGLVVPIAIDASDASKMVIDVAGGTAPKRPVHLVLVYFDSHEDVVIDRGENRGRTIAYWNAVRAIETIGMWDGKPLRVDIPMSELAAKKAAGCAVLLQEVVGEDKPGAIIGAAIVPSRSG